MSLPAARFKSDTALFDKVQYDVLPQCSILHLYVSSLYRSTVKNWPAVIEPRGKNTGLRCWLTNQLVEDVGQRVTQGQNIHPISISMRTTREECSPVVEAPPQVCERVKAL